MQKARIPTDPARSAYDVVIVGGAMMGAAAAWFLADSSDFDGRVLVVERDPGYSACSTVHSNSCLRQQFSTALNVEISRFCADYIRDFRASMGGDRRVPGVDMHAFGYMYLAGSESAAEALRAAQAVQAACGAETRLLTPDEIAAAYPFYDLQGVLLGSHNTTDEGYWDSGTVFDWWRRMARERGVEFIAGEVTGMTLSPAGGRVERVTLASGVSVACGHVVNASGPRAAHTARMAGIALPVEPRKRFTWVFSAAHPLDRALPLTVDPSGVHVRQDGPGTYMAGASPDPDPAVDPGDFTMDHDLWESRVWPAIAARIPQFDALRVISEWAGHYAYNTLDRNAVTGPHPEVANFLFMNGFSGHGLQQAPAMGRGIAEWIAHGAYRSLDLRPFHYERILHGAPLSESAVI
ncbi:FAD-dependent oxidoreductase [Roseovarius salis]|uniref:NAD(P)/FAD-dependent oxidoreductase n=1 Tax=Roseovarius salis TaxID=3376063 RepID=UPI0037CC8245